MRLTFVKTLEKLAEKDERIVLLTADLGFTVFEKFRKKFPSRFFNLGVAEQNMIGMAAGLALSGKIPVTYTFATFTSMRAFEFIRNDICYHNANVKMFSLGGGFAYGLAGFTHINFEDLSLLRPLPNLTILSPSGPVEVEILTKKAVKLNGPVYIRSTKVREPIIHQKKPKLTIGKGFVYQKGKKVAIFSTGGITANVIKSFKLLEKQNLNPTLVIVHTIKPLDEKLIKNIAKTHQYIFSVEEHSTIGGLGSAVAEVLAESKSKVKFKRLGIHNSFLKTVGNQKFLRSRFGLSPAKIAHTIINSTTS